MSKEFIEEQLRESALVLERFLNDARLIESVDKAGRLMSDSILKGGKIISCGNGGSMSDAAHFAEELSGKYRENRKALPGLAISDSGHISCTANDYGYEYVFSRFVEAHGKSGDILLAISTSGNSPNVLNACRTAHDNGMKVAALTGNNGGKLAELSDVEIRVPHSGYADRIQEMHIKIIHCLIGLIEHKTLKSD